MDDSGMVVGYIVLAVVGLGGVIGLATGRAIGASYSEGFGILRGDAALTCNMVYIGLAVAGAIVLTVIGRG